MKKALVVVNMLFASATVWGMIPNDGNGQQNSRGSIFDMNDIRREVEEIGNIETKFKVEDYAEPSIEESSNSLCDAILQPDFEKVKRLVCKKADRTSVLNLILAHDNYRRYNKKMPNAQFLKYHNLIFRSPDIKLVNFPYEGGETPLHTAAYDRNEDIVRCLINHGAEIDKPMVDGGTPLYGVMQGFILEGFSRYVLEGATLENIIEGFKRGGILLDADAVNNIRESIIERNKCCKVIKILLENGANANGVTNDTKPLMLAWEYKFYNAVESLIEYGADVNVIPLTDVILQGYNVAFIEYLIDHDVDVNKKNADGAAPLHAAIQVNDPISATYLVKTLLENGADVNMEGYKGTTALMSASYLGREDIVRYLIEYDAAINKERKNDGTTALWEASRIGNTTIVQHFIDHGAEIDAERNDGITPLWIAAQNGHEDVVRILAEHSADITKSRNTDGVTPLMIAVDKKKGSVVKYLLQRLMPNEVQRSGLEATALSFIPRLMPMGVVEYYGYDNFIQRLLQMLRQQ